MKFRFVAIVAVCFSCSSLVSCFSSSPPDGYLAKRADGAVFFQFTVNGNQLSGHMQGIAETNAVPPQAKSFSTAVMGTVNGASITITISAFGFSSSVTGQLLGNTLTLDVPQPDGHLQSENFQGASLQEYNQAVDDVQKKVGQLDQQYYNNQATATTQYNNDQATASAIAATQTAQQQEQQAVSAANSALGSALSTLKSDASTLSSFSNTSTMTGYANDWQAMQKDYTAEQNDAQAGCGPSSSNYSQVSADDNQVSADSNQIRADDNQLSADKNQYDSDLSPVQNDIQAVKDAWAQLQQSAANNTTGTPAAAYTSDDVNNALHNAQSAENAAGGTWQSAKSNAAQYDQEASALQKKADDLPASMHCS